MARACLRPDMARVLMVSNAGGVEEASSALNRLMAEVGGPGYQLHDEIPGDRTLAYSAAEVAHVDQMGSILFHKGNIDPRRFVLSEEAELLVFSRLYAFSKHLVALQKS